MRTFDKAFLVIFIVLALLAVAVVVVLNVFSFR